MNLPPIEVTDHVRERVPSLFYFLLITASREQDSCSRESVR
jgi:phosphopentomutase